MKQKRNDRPKKRAQGPSSPKSSVPVYRKTTQRQAATLVAAVLDQAMDQVIVGVVRRASETPLGQIMLDAGALCTLGDDPPAFLFKQ